MGCPRCWGERFRVIAPGYFECESVAAPTFVPDQARPGQMRPLYGGACGHLWQDGSGQGGPVCHECGTFAVGRCPTCGVAVCGMHSWLMAGRRLCRTDARAVQKAEEDRKGLVARHREEHAAAVAEVVRLRGEVADRRLRELLRDLKAVGSPGLVDREQVTYEDRPFTKKRRPVVKRLDRAWPVGPLVWAWNYRYYGDDFSGKAAVPSAVLPSGVIVELEPGQHAESRAGRLNYAPHVLQTERVVAALGHHLAGEALPPYRQGDANEDDAGRYIDRIERVKKAEETADQASLHLISGSGTSEDLRRAVNELTAAATALDDLVLVVNATWLHGPGGDRIIAAQASAGLTRTRAEQMLTG